MKHIFYLLLGTVLLAGCLNGDNTNEGSEEGSSAPKKNISKRDNSITKTNSYSNLFFDSASLAGYIASNKVPDSIGNRMVSFYNTRNYQAAWFTSDGFTEEAQAFWNLFDHYLTYSGDTTLKNKPLEKRMNRLLVDSFSVNANDKGFRETEWQLTQSLISYALKNFEKGYVKRKELERFVPFKKADPIQLADSLLTKKHKDNKYFEDINVAYKALKGQLQKYYDIHKEGGLPTIPSLQKSLKKGAAAPQVTLIKQYLAKTGDMPAGDTSAVYDDTLAQGITSIQQRFGMKPTGMLSKELIAAMNVPVSERIEQLLINMGRMRWMPSQPNGTLILVNIPEFILHVLENGKKVWDMNVVVGKEGHSTTQFTGTMNQIVFAPYWNIPPSIVTKEIMPEIEKDAHYLEKNEMEDQGDKDGDGINDIRQLPGEKNALGKVKFLFPNSFDIYLHDTPAKSLFSRDKRAFSHGCIRLADAQKMAEYLLRNDEEWDAGKIQEAMNTKEQKVVKLKEKAEVFITYYTAWVDEEGRLNFRDDVYGHDKKIKAQLFQ
jgi:L,D-transpeptidase YcbB